MINSQKNNCTRQAVRLAIVQHGDYADALRILHDDLPEPYFGMKHTVTFLEQMLSQVNYRLISVDAPAYVLEREHGEIQGLSRPDWPKLSKLPWSWSVYRAVRSFRPTHLLVRTGGILALPTLEYAISRGINTLVVMAGYIEESGWRNRWVSRRLAKALSHPCVWKVANHRRPAARSVVAAGVDPRKVIAWDYDQLPLPSEAPVKRRDLSEPCLVAYAGAVVEGKGIGDLVRAVTLLWDQGQPVELQVCGDGPLLEPLRQSVAHLPEGLVRFLGRVGNDRVQLLFRQATLVCVPSRRNRSEGFPLTVSEALAARTPVICTNHPVIENLLVDGEGVSIVESGQPLALASAIRTIANDPALYEQLSRTAPAAFARLSADTTFDQLLTEWQSTWLREPTALST